MCPASIANVSGLDVATASAPMNPIVASRACLFIGENVDSWRVGV